MGLVTHPDAIQFLTSGETAGVHDIVITDNVIDRGSGSAVQGIFMTDQVGTLPYQNVTISGNMLVGTMYNGIMVNDGINLNISNNTVAGLPDMKSWIRVEGSTDAVLNHNIAATLVQTGNTNLSVTDFTNLLPSTDQSTQLLQTWLSQHGAVSTIYQNEQMWLAPVDTTSTSTSTSGGTSTTTTGTTTGTSTGTTSTTSGSTGTTTGTTSGSTTGTSTGTTSGSTTGGTGHGGTKGHQVMHKLDQTSDLSTTKVITTAQASATTSIVASTSTQSGASKPLDHSSDHFDFAWSSPAKSLASIAVHHELDAHVQPAFYAGQGSPVLPSSIHQNEWVHDFFAVHDHSLI